MAAPGRPTLCDVTRGSGSEAGTEDWTSAGGRTEADVGLRASSEVSLWSLLLVPAIFRLKLAKTRQKTQRSKDPKKGGREQ